MALPSKLMRPTLTAGRGRVKRAPASGGCCDTLRPMAIPARRTWAAVVRLLERDERLFAFPLAVDLLLIFALLYLTGGGDSLFVNLFYPLVAVNAYYFGRWVGLLLTLMAGLLYWAAAFLAQPEASWTAVVMVMAFVGLPGFAVGHVADRERRAR